MKRIMTIICALAFFGAALSAQNAADTIKVSRNESETLVIIVKEKNSVDRQIKKQQRLSCSHRALLANKAVWGITSSHGFSFGNGLYVGGGAGFTAELENTTSYFVPVFADIKYSFAKTFVTPFVNLKGGAVVDITNSGLRTYANPAVGLDIARFSVKAGYEYQLGFWGHRDGEHMHNVKLAVANTF